MVSSTAQRVAELLLAFESGPGGGPVDRSVSELSRRVGRERSQVSRMLKSLAKARLVEQDLESRRYRLGWPVRVMATGAGDQMLVHAARPMLQAVVGRTGEVALLSVQEGNRSLTVMREESQNSLQGGGWVGRRSEMHCTASGRALLFDADDELVEALTAEDLSVARRPTVNAPRDLAGLLTRLRSERQQGYALAVEEIEVGLTSVSVPVRNVQGHLLAVLNVSGPTSRMARPQVEGAARLLVSASAAVTRSLCTQQPS